MTRREQLEQMLAGSSNDLFLKYAVAMAYSSEGNNAEAERRLADINLTHPDDVASWFQRGKLLAKLHSRGGLQHAALSVRPPPSRSGVRYSGLHQRRVAFEVQSASAVPGIQVSQWNIRGVKVAARNDASAFPRFVVAVDVARQSMFTLRLVVLPLALIVALSWSVFWMERSSLGDRISVSFVGILTAVAYQIFVGDLLPHVSYMTLMHAFLNVSFFVMCATVVINLAVGHCDRNGRGELGDVIDLRCRWIFPLAYLVSLILGFVIMFYLL